LIQDPGAPDRSKFTRRTPRSDLDKIKLLKGMFLI